ncbi:MAG: aspartate carbamoyltransferase catalytic subunit [bacterium]|nr:aspartate carbamoyltransferase catalytic subunit [bacterium]MXZ30555.1 aspartate carbamoyltransferase catalytic subunit [Acidimicrobiia bacterium]MDE0668274.1 aspartate carbamoyltransferase catalytic subunit [bacterium]MYB24656.1 aspartate carbamoyltransferase catalytic subunit [Acidimicrobiia bacterium]MYE67656.1 aspartate carbamoyltransferase catalytic subunit [Acidimicrobiia bacterium]
MSGRRHLLSVGDLGADGLREILRLADSFAEVNTRAIPKVPALRGRTVASLFFEDSTRTRLSFETAAKRLSADTVTFSAGSSSLSKGESLRDTAQTVTAMGVDCVVVRHRSAGAAVALSRWLDAAVINAGDGCHEHPTQALLDCYTIQQRLGGIEGRRVAIVGDIAHSRVARSLVAALQLLDASVTLVAPATLLPPAVEAWGVGLSSNLDDVVPRADVVYLLRLQRERQERALLPSEREFHERFGLSAERARRLADHAIVMHPGPLNRGVEIGAEVPEMTCATISEQVANGVSVRMAALFWLLGVPAGIASPPGAEVSPAPEPASAAEVGGD